MNFYVGGCGHRVYFEGPVCHVGPCAECEEQPAAVRCGRTPAPMHLTELTETARQLHRWRAPLVLCGAEVADVEPDGEDQDCADCRDCLRYCPECVRVAVAQSGLTCDCPA